LYYQYGVETSILAVLSPGAWPAAVKGNLAKSKPKLGGLPKVGPFGLPADFLISPEAVVEATHYGEHANEQWSLDDVLEMTGATAS
jgi:hypothetical protein